MPKHKPTLSEQIIDFDKKSLNKINAVQENPHHSENAAQVSYNLTVANLDVNARAALNVIEMNKKTMISSSDELNDMLTQENTRILRDLSDKDRQAVLAVQARQSTLGIKGDKNVNISSSPKRPGSSASVTHSH